MGGPLLGHPMPLNRMGTAVFLHGRGYFPDASIGKPRCRLQPTCGGLGKCRGLTFSNSPAMFSTAR